MEINVNGVIVSSDDAWVYEYFDIEHTSPNTIIESLKDYVGDVTVNISSGGGDLFAGTQMYTALKNHNGKVIVKVNSLAASAASIIAMAGDKVLMSPVACLMIHNASTVSSGNKNDMEHMKDVLTSLDKSIAAAYEIKTGLSESELLDMMNKETWLSAKDAVEKGFADEIMFNDNVKVAASFGSGLLPNEVINKIKNEIFKNKPKQNINNDLELEKAKLELLLL